MMDFEKLVEQNNAAIKAGRNEVVAKNLKNLKGKNIPRSWRLPLAQNCRRAGLYFEGISMLRKLIYSSGRQGRSAPSANELAEYGILLLSAGVRNEAEQIFNRVDEKKAPEVFKYRAFLKMTRWQYDSAIADFHAFLATHPSAYAALVAKINLSLAYIESDRFGEAEALLRESIHSSRQQGYVRLQMNCWEFRAHLNVMRGNLAAAKRDVAEGEAIEGKVKDSENSIFLKWNRIIQALEHRTVAPLEEVRKLAVAKQRWEDLRFADFIEQHLSFDHGKYLHLYFGTPYDEYRLRLNREFHLTTDRIVYYVGEKSAPRYDLRSGEINGLIYDGLSPGGKSHQLVEVLTRDFYHPLSVGGVFSELFPDEKFDPVRSPGRVQEVIARTKKAFEKNRIPIALVERSGFISCEIKGNMSFLVPLQRKSVTATSMHFERLRLVFPVGVEFKAKDASRKLGIARQTVRRVLSWGSSQGQLERTSAHKDASYRFVLPEGMRLPPPAEGVDETNEEFVHRQTG